MRRPLIVKTGSTLPGLRERRGDYEDWIAEGMGLARDAVDVVSVHEGEPLPDPACVAGVVVSGSSAMVSDGEDWSERAAAWLADAVRARTPLLGICYGHQLLAHALGGRVGPNPRGREIGTVTVELLEAAGSDALLGDLPGEIVVQVTHVESVLELPAGARLLASSAADPHQAFSVGDSTWGVQFHPEFDGDVIRAYLDSRRAIIRGEGIDPEPLRRAARDSPHGPAVLRRFSALLAD